jgi:DDE superfamily endonuclease
VALKRTAWREAQPTLDVTQLIFVDETWVKTNMVRLHGRATRGQRLVDKTAHGHWKTSTFLAGLRDDGAIAPGVFDGAINGELFLAWVEQVLVPTLRLGDIVVMDTLSSHKRAAVKDAIEAAGAALSSCRPTAPTSTRSRWCSPSSRPACAAGGRKRWRDCGRP